jgi:hypothetical protein
MSSRGDDYRERERAFKAKGSLEHLASSSRARISLRLTVTAHLESGFRNSTNVMMPSPASIG